MSYPLIRTAQLEDAPGIASLTIELGYAVSIEDTSQWLSELLGSHLHRVLVAAGTNDGLLGWVLIERRISLETGIKAEMSGVIVGPRFRRTGVGSLLTAAAEQWAIEQNIPKIHVSSDMTRKESHSFYLSLGYRHTKTSHHYKKPLLNDHKEDQNGSSHSDRQEHHHPE